MVEDQALNPQNSEQILTSFHEWMIQQARAAKLANRTNQPSYPDSTSRKETHFPSIAPELFVKFSNAWHENPIDRSEQANVAGRSNRSSFERWIFRISSGLLIAIVVAVVWQGYRDDQTMRLVQAWKHSSAVWLSAALGTSPRQSETAAEPSNELLDQAASAPAVTATPTKEFAELNEQLQTVVNDIAVLRRNVEQLSARQEQMSRDILTVQATEQNVSEKISSLTQQAPPVHAAPRRSVPRLVHSETPRQPAAASVSSQPSPAAAASPINQPPRPPLPLPAPTETPAPVH